MTVNSHSITVGTHKQYANFVGYSSHPTEPYGACWNQVVAPGFEIYSFYADTDKNELHFRVVGLDGTPPEGNTLDFLDLPLEHARFYGVDAHYSTLGATAWWKWTGAGITMVVGSELGFIIATP